MLHVQKEIKLKFRNSKVFRSFSNTKCAVKPCKTNKLSLTPCYVERMALMEEERNLRHGVGGGGWMGSTHLILRKMLSKSRFISTRVLVWCRKREGGRGPLRTCPRIAPFCVLSSLTVLGITEMLLFNSPTTLQQR